MLSKRHSDSCKKNIGRLNSLGLNKHFGESNPRWNGGNRLVGNYPCPVCGKVLFREKRYAELRCVVCGRQHKKPRVLSSGVTRSAFYWRARKLLKKSGNFLTSDQHVHHINGDWTDNRIDNLEIVSKYEHRRKYHNKKSRTSLSYS